MSSILQALKKLEEAPPSQPESIPPSAVPSRSLTKGFVTRQRAWGILSLFLLVGLTAALGFGIWNYRFSSQENPLSMPDADKTTQATEPLTMMKPKLTTPLSASKKQPDRSSKEPEEQKSMPPSSSNRPATHETSQQVLSRTHDKEHVQVPETDTARLHPSQAQQNDTTAYSAINYEHSYSDLQSRQKEEMSLQALVWSKKVKERWAMINGHIVRTGDLVGQATLVHIDRDFIVLSQKGKQWKHLFQK